MFALLKSVVDLATDAAKVVVAPVEIVADLAGAAIKSVADVKSLKD